MTAVLIKLLPVLVDQILTPLVLAAVAAAAAALAKKWHVQGKVSAGEDLANRVSSVIADTVRALIQTEAEALKAAAADGKLTKEDAAMLKQKAVETVKAHLSPKELAKHVKGSDVNLVLGVAVEASLSRLKGKVGGWL
jgi:hypothetical protein